MIRASHKIETPVKSRRLFIDGIDEQADTPSLGINSLRPAQGIDQQQFADALALTGLIDHQPTFYVWSLGPIIACDLLHSEGALLRESGQG